MFINLNFNSHPMNDFINIFILRLTNQITISFTLFSYDFLAIFIIFQELLFYCPVFRCYSIQTHLKIPLTNQKRKEQ